MISNIDKSEAIPMLFIPSVEQTAMKTLKKEYALYIHIPYCEKKCHFCSIPVTEYSCAVTPQVRQTGNRLSGLAGTAYASLLT